MFWIYMGAIGFLLGVAWLSSAMQAPAGQVV
jgi:hypothetical protein